MTKKHENTHQDPQPNHGNDSKGHTNNGKKEGYSKPNPSRPAKPAKSSSAVASWSNELFNN